LSATPHRRRSLVPFAACLLPLAIAFATSQPAWSQTPGATAAPPASEGIRGTRQGIFDAWLAADAAVVGTYRGVDSTLGPIYHILEVEDVWMGTPAKGRLVFKAPRGVRVTRGGKALFFLWDRLAGASDSFIEESKAREGDNLWHEIGPDSLAIYLVPFGAWTYAFSGDEIVLRGQSAFPTKLSLFALRKDLLDYEASLRPEKLYARAATVVHARVVRVELAPRMSHGIVIERWVRAEMAKIATLKGQAPDTLQLRFLSFPRAPRFRPQEEVVLLLARGPEGLYLDQGKRSVLHVVKGEVLEVSRPLSEFVKSVGGR
jgi:hypothetical protein